MLNATLDLEALHGKRLAVFGVSNRHRTAAQRAETVRAFVKDVVPHKYMESDAQVGKIVVTRRSS